jgi:paired amphipathic helix protein Sin3a
VVALVEKLTTKDSLDTPGVIHRVSSLFRGHASLIKGFQTFLPPGYQLECSEGGQDTELVITTPSGGVIRHPLPMSIDISTEQRIADPSGPAPTAAVPAVAPIPPVARPPVAPIPVPTPVVVSAPPPVIEQPQRDLKLGPLPPAQVLAPPPQASTSALATTPGAAGTLAAPTSTGKPVIEFNHAINYVNKIKQRFSGDPQTYKVFLEILQTYQKEQRPIQDARSTSYLRLTS